MKRGRPLRRVNKARRRRLYERNFGDKANWIRSLPCLRCGLPPDSEGIHAAHVLARGLGGCGAGKESLVPLCGPRGCHAEQEGMSIARYLEETGIDLEMEAERMETRWQSVRP